MKSAPLIVLLVVCLVPVWSEDANALYREAKSYLNKGQHFFQQAMNDTSGGKARADLCSKARKEYFEATLKAEAYNKLTGKGDDLLQEIQMNDYSAFKMAPDNVWSPPERPEPALSGPTPKKRGAFLGGAAVIFAVVVVAAVAGAVAFVRVNAGRKKLRGGGSQRVSQRVPQQAPSRASARAKNQSGRKAAPASGRRPAGPSERRSARR